ncbi:MAG: HIT family protein [Planctomycetes bacterium]|nr:HIT family protein [Planctomycetota bacterium]
MADCIFCKIIAGQIPCTKVYEDAACLVFMDINPISPGHTLVVPKKHYEAITEMPAEEAAALYKPIPALAAAVKAALKAEALNVLQNNGRAAGQAVDHLHVHLIPRWSGDGLGFRWPAKKADFAVLAKQAEAIKAGLRLEACG